MSNVSFNGITKLITVNTGITSIDVGLDLYSEWKKWVLLDDNAKYLPAFSAIGGDLLGDNRYLGSTYFLENEWKIKPYEGNHTLSVSGNLYTRDGTSPFIQTIGNYNVLISMQVSNLIDTISTTGGSDLTSDEIATAVWNKTIPETPVPNSFGEWISGRLLTVAHFLGIK